MIKELRNTFSWFYQKKSKYSTKATLIIQVWFSFLGWGLLYQPQIMTMSVEQEKLSTKHPTWPDLVESQQLTA
jgi:hypothetical protein